MAGSRADLLVRAPRAVVGGAERAVSVAVHDGRVVGVHALDERLEAAQVVTLADDEVLLPGLVDTHVHVNEPGRTHWEGFASATRAAAAGGVTTIVDMPLNSVPPTTTVEALQQKRSVARGQVHVDVGFWGGAVPGNLGDLRPMHDAGVFGFKAFLLHSGVDEFPPLDPAQVEAVMAHAASFGSMVIVHAEDAETIATAPAARGRSYAGFLRSRPAEAEQRAVARVIAAARATGARAHVLHLSDAGALAPIAVARADGVRISVETCPHYLALAAEDIPDGATQFKCCPPIRDSANRDRLWQGLVDGTIQTVVSDHSPCTVDLKRLDVGDFDAAWGGIASLQLGLAAVWTQARQRGHCLADVVRWMAEGPARQVGLVAKGRIAVGADADFAVFAPDESFVVDVGRLHHRNPVSAYAGSTLTGTVRRTWLRGTTVDPAGEPHGRLLRRGQP